MSKPHTADFTANIYDIRYVLCALCQDFIVFHRKKMRFLYRSSAGAGGSAGGGSGWTLPVSQRGIALWKTSGTFTGSSVCHGRKPRTHSQGINGILISRGLSQRLLGGRSGAGHPTALPGAGGDPGAGGSSARPPGEKHPRMAAQPWRECRRGGIAPCPHPTDGAA